MKLSHIRKGKNFHCPFKESKKPVKKPTERFCRSYRHKLRVGRDGNEYVRKGVREDVGYRDADVSKKLGRKEECSRKREKNTYGIVRKR